MLATLVAAPPLCVPCDRCVRHLRVRRSVMRRSPQYPPRSSQTFTNKHFSNKRTSTLEDQRHVPKLTRCSVASVELSHLGFFAAFLYFMNSVRIRVGLAL